MTSNVSKGYSVDDWNRELTYLLIPNDIIVSLYILVGIIGNSLVLYVYKTKFTGKLDDRYFVPHLAMTDLFACISSSSMAIAGNVMYVSFKNNYLCKVWWFFAAIATFLSSYTLLIIAIQRYLKVVRVHGKQMNLKMNQIALVSALVFSVMCAAPTLLLYGSVPFPNTDGTLIGWRCCKIKNKYKVISIIYGTFIGLLFVLVIGSLIGIYAKIGRTIFVHMRHTKHLLKSKSEKSSSSTKTTSVDDNSSDVKELEVAAENFNRQAKTANKCEIGVTTPANQHEIINRRILHKFTLMFTLITVIYLICYVPLVLLMLVEAIIPTFWDNLTNKNRAAMLFVYQMFIINNIANPFVYAFMDNRFQTELKKLFHCCIGK